MKRIILRLTWFTTSHQMDHNIAIVKAVDQMTSELASEIAVLRDQMTLHRHHVSQVLAGVEASLRAEILGSDRRGDQIEADLVRLSATMASLQTRLESLSSEIATLTGTTGMVPNSDMAEVRTLPGQSRR